jgi:hypothetical protein
MMGRRERAGTGIWILAAGAMLGLAGALFLLRRSRRRVPRLPADLRELEDSVIDALRRDAVLRHRGIDVAALAPGIIELTGLVDSADEGQHAAAVAHNVAGVRTVLNRLDALELQRRLRPRTQPSQHTGTRWYGMNVGMGRRRQSRQTDPPRRDDRSDLIEQALVPPRPDEALADLAEQQIDTTPIRANEIS